MRDCGGLGVAAERMRRLAAPGIFLGACLAAPPAWPIGLSLPMISTEGQGEQDLTGLVVLILLLFATFTAVLHLLGRHNWTRREKHGEGRARDRPAQAPSGCVPLWSPLAIRPLFPTQAMAPSNRGASLKNGSSGPAVDSGSFRQEGPNHPNVALRKLG